MAEQRFTVGQDAPLLVSLYGFFPTMSKTGVKNMLAKGQILVNGKTCAAFDHPLTKGDVVTVLPKGISIARAMRSDAREELEKTSQIRQECTANDANGSHSHHNLRQMWLNGRTSSPSKTKGLIENCKTHNSTPFLEISNSKTSKEKQSAMHNTQRFERRLR